MKQIVTIVVLLLGLSRHSQAQAVLTATEESYQPQSRHSASTLIARNLIGQRANVTYSAAQSVTLQPGFTAQSGAVFSASIQAYSPDFQESVADQLTLKAYPNPFRQQTRMEYTLPRAGKVQGVLTNVQGQVVRQSTVDGVQEQGVHHLDLSAGELPDGVYIYQLQLGTEQKTIRLIKQTP